MSNSCLSDQLLIMEKEVQSVFYIVYAVIGTAGVVGNIFMICACARYTDRSVQAFFHRLLFNRKWSLLTRCQRVFTINQKYMFNVARADSYDTLCFFQKPRFFYILKEKVLCENKSRLRKISLKSIEYLPGNICIFKLCFSHRGVNNDCLRVSAYCSG